MPLPATNVKGNEPFNVYQKMRWFSRITDMQQCSSQSSGSPVWKLVITSRVPLKVKTDFGYTLKNTQGGLHGRQLLITNITVE